MTGEAAEGRAAYHHLPVMCGEVVELLSVVPDGVVVDATVGGGGHAAALLDRCPGLRLVGLDRDPSALRAAAARLADHSRRVTLRHARFDALGEILDELGHSETTACLFDLGVSSPQLDLAERGFSYRLDGPLDMRMDPTAGPTAADLVNDTEESVLADMLRRNADERHCRRIARAIVAGRPFATTAELAQTVARAMPSSSSRRAHPARRTFQALRIEVNAELEVLQTALAAALERLATGGRVAVISYHSGEDRIVKTAFRRAAGELPPPLPGLPRPPAPAPTVRLLGRRPRTPSAAETASNPRSGAARLRAAERLAVDV